MSKVFNFYGGTITYKGDTDTYLQIYNTLIDEAGKAKSKYRKAYKDWGDVETFLDYGYGYGISLMEDIFKKFADVFMAHRYYNFSEDLFTKHRLYHEVTNEFVSAYFDVERRYEEIENVKRADEARREYRKNTRSRVIGGGFGIKGAVKGMAMAGAINMGTGLAHSTYNMIGNLFSSMSASSSKADLYDSSEDYVCESLKQSIRDMMVIFDDLLKINVSFDQDKAEKIIKNIDDNIITGSQRIVALQDALRAYPFEEYLYYLVDKYYDDAEENVMPIAEYFGVPVKRYFRQLCTVNGYTFEDRKLADKVRLHFDKMLQSVDETIKKDILPKFFKTDFLKKHEEKDALRFLLGYYYNLIDICPNNSAVLRYCNHNIDFFSKQLKEMGEIINNKALKANDTGLVDLIIALYRHYYLKNKNYRLYCGNEITKELKDEIAKEFGLETDSKIYLVDKEGGYTCSYILYDEGLIVENEFIDIESLSFAKRNGTLKIKKEFMGNTIQVGENKYSTVKSYDKILELFKCIEGVARALLCKNYIHILHNHSITNEQKNIMHHALGSSYYFGEGLPNNDVKAFYWLIQAALDNFPNAQLLLGSLYVQDARFGLGVKKDLAKAKFWIQIAANNGYQLAIDTLNQDKFELNGVKTATEREVYSGREYMLPLKKMNIVVEGVNDTEPPKFEKEYYNPLKDVDIKSDPKKENTPLPSTENEKEDKTQTVGNSAETVISSQSESVTPTFCAYCGKKLISGIQFCPYCGKKIIVMSEAANSIQNNEESSKYNEIEQTKTPISETKHDNVCESKVYSFDAQSEFIDESTEVQTASYNINGIQDNLSEDFTDDEGDFADESFFDGIGADTIESTEENISTEETSSDFCKEIEDNGINQDISKIDVKKFEMFRDLNKELLDSHSDAFMIWENLAENKVRNVLDSYAKDKGIQAGDIKILFDNTLFGSAKEGFIMTDEFVIGSVSKQMIPLREIEYLELDKGSCYIYAEPMHQGLSRTTTNDFIVNGIDRINEIIFGFGKEDIAKSRTSDYTNSLTPAIVDQGLSSVRNSLTQEQIKGLDAIGERLYILDGITEKKAKNAVSSYAKGFGLQAGDVKVLYDDTVFGNAKDGMIMTNRFIIDNKNKQLIPINQIQYLGVVKLEKKASDVLVEPMHIRILHSIGNIDPDLLQLFIDRINQYVFNYPDESEALQYECPICGNLIKYKAASCNNCGTPLTW